MNRSKYNRPPFPQTMLKENEAILKTTLDLVKMEKRDNKKWLNKLLCWNSEHDCRKIIIVIIGIGHEYLSYCYFSWRILL